MILDTYKAVENLVSKGIKKEHAIALTKMINDQNSDLATKSDLALVRSELKSDIATVKKDIENIKEQMATKADISNIINELGLIKKDFVWMKALLAGVMGLLVKIAFF